MQRQALTAEQEREFMKGVIDFIKNELISKPGNNSVTARDLCKRIPGLAISQLSDWKYGRKPFTTCMKQGLHSYLVEQLAALTSKDENTAKITQLNTIITQLSEILHTRPWIEERELQGSIDDENRIIKKVIRFLKLNVLSTWSEQKGSDAKICAEIGIGQNLFSPWKNGKNHFTVSMKEKLYHYLTQQETKFKNNDEYKTLVNELSQIRKTTPWKIKRRSSQLATKNLSGESATKRTKLADTKLADSQMTSINSLSTSSTPAPSVTDSESTNGDSQPSVHAPYEALDSEASTLPQPETFYGRQSDAFGNLPLENNFSREFAPTYEEPDNLFDLENDGALPKANTEPSYLFQFSIFKPPQANVFELELDKEAELEHTINTFLSNQ